MKRVTAIVVWTLAIAAPAAAEFVALPAALPGLNGGDAAWGDVDGDGDLDLVLCGYNGAEAILRVFRNEGGTFTVTASLPGLILGAVAWGDADGDGDLDLAACGFGTEGTPVTSLYRNNGSGSFSPVSIELQGCDNGDLAWGDFDNDGDLDLVLTGDTPAGRTSAIYRNDGDFVFTRIQDSVAGVADGVVLWLDADVDGDLDALVSGAPTNGKLTRLYRNDGFEVFSPLDVGLPQLDYSAAAWADFDRDGDPDLVLSGGSGYPDRVTRVCRNDGPAGFVDTGAVLPGLLDGAAAWGDYDNDGDPDLLLCGDAGGTSWLSLVYRNQGYGAFSDAGAGLSGVSDCAAAWGDEDGDGDLDIVLTGTSLAGPLTAVYRNDGEPANAPPLPPTGLATTVTADRVTFQWTVGADDHTPTAVLTGNLRVGRSPGAQDVCPAQSRPDGRRLLPAAGNVPHGTAWTLTLPPGTYYWSVQAIDEAYAGSAFAPEQVVTVAYGESPYVEVASGLDNAPREAAEWGDYDNDGDLDLVLLGYDGYHRRTEIYRNDDGTFTDIGAGLLGLDLGDVAWGDYDGDGDLDLLEVGQPDGGGGYTRIYRNDGGAFTTIGSNPPGGLSGSVAWGDFDNDGDLDAFVAGHVLYGESFARIYRNDGGDQFPESPAVLAGFDMGDVAVGDYDGDGDVDLLACGFDVDFHPAAWLYRNDGDWVFTPVDAGLVGTDRGFVAFGDYDADGDLDIAIAGDTRTGSVARIYRNDGGDVFTDIDAGLRGLSYSDGMFGDYDADGDLDLLICGYTDLDEAMLRIYRNLGDDVFVDLFANLPVCGTDVRWGDFDADGDLDIYYPRGTHILRNDGGAVDTPPGAPAGLAASVAGGRLLLAWSAAADAETPPPGLSYNLRVGTAPGAGDIVAPMAAIPDGRRRVVGLGNASQSTAWTVILPPDAGQVWWSVQAIDGSLAGGPFAPEQSLQVSGVPEAPVVGDGVLHPPYPNPFNPRVTIPFTVARRQTVSLTIHDLAGRVVRRLVADELPAGTHRAVWDGTGDDGRAAASGRYVCRLVAGEWTDSRALTLVR